MSGDAAEWRVFTGDQLHEQPKEIRRQAEERMRQVPLTEIRIRGIGLEPGRAEAQLRVEPAGTRGAARPDHPDREVACTKLLETLARELRDAVAILCLGC